MADVYEVEDTLLRRRVALKILPPEFALSEERKRRFRHEIQAVAKASHRNIVAVFDVGVDDTQPYFTMELLHGGDLRDRIRAGISASEAVTALCQVCDGLLHAHSCGIVHRDIKPTNILFDRSGRVVVTDFGVSKAEAVRTQLTLEGRTLGTPHYMSPEQARGLVLDHRSDIYSLGVVLYECLCGKVPFDAANSMAIGIKHITDPHPQLVGATSTFNDCLDRLLSKEPSARPSNMHAVKRLIRSALESYSRAPTQALMAVSSDPSSTRAAGRPKRRALLRRSTAMVFVVTAGLVLSSLLAWKRWDSASLVTVEASIGVVVGATLPRSERQDRIGRDWVQRSGPAAGTWHVRGNGNRQRLEGWGISRSIPHDSGAATQALTGDVTGDGTQDLVFVTRSAILIFHEHGEETIPTGFEAFQGVLVDSPERASGAKTVAFSSQDHPETLIGFAQYQDGLGFETSRIKAPRYAGAAAFPIAAPNDTDLIIAYKTGYGTGTRGLSRINRFTAEEVWHFDTGPYIDPGSAVADVDGDGLLEIAVHSYSPHNGRSANSLSDGQLYGMVFKENGQLLSAPLLNADLAGGSNGRVYPAFVDLMGDQKLEVLALAFSDQVYQGQSALEMRDPRTGELLRRFIYESTRNDVRMEMSIAGMGERALIMLSARPHSGGGVAELITLNHQLQVINRRNLDNSERVYRMLSTDLNGDGIVDIIATSREMVFCVDSESLDRLWSVPLPPGANYVMSMVPHDFDRDGRLDILVADFNALHVISGPADG